MYAWYYLSPILGCEHDYLQEFYDVKESRIWTTAFAELLIGSIPLLLATRYTNSKAPES